MRHFLSRREALVAATGTVLGMLCSARSTPADEAATKPIATAVPPPVATADPGDCDAHSPIYSFDSKGRVSSIIAPLDPNRRRAWSF